MDLIKDIGVLFVTGFSMIGDLFETLFIHPDVRNLIDIAVLTVVIYLILKKLKQTRASTIGIGIGIVALFAIISELLQMHAMKWITGEMLSVWPVLLGVVFQPELRRMLSQTGVKNKKIFGGTQKSKSEEADNCIREIVTAMTDMSRKRIGALIIIERGTMIDDICQTGTEVDAKITAALIENIFEPNTPLHDGAMVIRNWRIKAAACLLPLSENTSISRELGTRHRAAIGLSETVDSISLIVSEETGAMSIAVDGTMRRNYEPGTLTMRLKDLLTHKDDGTVWTGSAEEKKEP